MVRKFETGYKLYCNYRTESNCDVHVTISSTMVVINIYRDGLFASYIYILAIKIPFALNKYSLNLLFVRSCSFLSRVSSCITKKRIHHDHQRCTQSSDYCWKMYSKISSITWYEISRNIFAKLFSKITRSLVILTSCREFRKFEKGMGTMYTGTWKMVWKMDERTNLVWRRSCIIFTWSSWFRNSIKLKLYRNRCNRNKESRIITWITIGTIYPVTSILIHFFQEFFRLDY